METINLERLDVKELDESDLVKTIGGVFWLPIASGIAILVSLFNNFGDVRHGLVDGWRGTPRYVD